MKYDTIDTVCRWAGRHNAVYSEDVTTLPTESLNLSGTNKFLSQAQYFTV